MSPEIHGAVKNPDDLKGLARDPKQDDMLALGCDLTRGKEVMPEAMESRILANLSESPPDSVQVGLLLGSTPSLQGVVPDGSEILQGRKGEFEPHDSERMADKKSSLDPIAMVCPASNWANPMAASLISQSFSRS